MINPAIRPGSSPFRPGRVGRDVVFTARELMASNLSSRIAPSALAALASVTVLITAGCPASRKEAAEARSSLYDADFALVYSASVAAVRDLYPDYRDDPAAGRIATSWHQVKYTDPGADDPKSQAVADRATGAATATGTFGGPTSVVRRTNFIRFDVLVSGGRPWRVKVKGVASQLVPGDALPTELHGAAEPHWLAGRTDALVVSIHRRLKKYAMVVPVEVEAVAVEAAPAATIAGDIPEGARATAIAVVASIRLRDPAALRTQLADDVRWSLGAPPGVDGAMAMWQADPSALAAMAKAIEAGCASVADEVQCPAQPSARSWRVRLGQRRGTWRLLAFVAGS